MEFTYQLNEFISNFWVENFNFIRTLNNVDPYQTPHSAASGLGLCYVLDTQLNKVGSSSELIYFYKQQNIIRGNYDKQGVLLF